MLLREPRGFEVPERSGIAGRVPRQTQADKAHRDHCHGGERWSARRARAVRWIAAYRDEAGKERCAHHGGDEKDARPRSMDAEERP